MAHVAPQAAIEAHLRHDPGVMAACLRVAEQVRSQAIEIAPRGTVGTGRYNFGRDTGEPPLHAQIVAERTPYGARARSRAEWSAPVEGGWGIYGVHGHMIEFGKPRTLTVKPNASNPTIHKVTINRTAGSPAQPFMARAGEIIAAQSDRLTWRPRFPWAEVA